MAKTSPSRTSRTSSTDDEDYFSFVDEDEKPKKREKPASKEREPVREKPQPKKEPKTISSGARKGWPEEVPVLVPEDICWAGDCGRGGSRSLDWWLYWTFFHVPPRKGKYADDEVDKVLREVLTERYGRRVKCMWTFMEYVEKNKEPSKAWQAACWNEAMRRLGYEIPERRCKDPGLR